MPRRHPSQTHPQQKRLLDLPCLQTMTVRLTRGPLRRSVLLLGGGLVFFLTATILNVLSGGETRFLLLEGLRLWPPVVQPVTCNPRKNVLFLKTHKCASSSVQNILLRFGEHHNLTFVLPTRNNYFGHPEPFRRLYIPANLNQTFNILTHHTRYNRKEMDLVMPSDTVYITIVRAPIDLLESLYSYYNLPDHYQKDLEELSTNRTEIEALLGRVRYYSRVGLNQMSFDLGLSSSHFSDERTIEKFCRKIDHEFDLIMVYERLDESLVLLSDLLCWSLEDVIVFKLNARKDKYRTKLSQEAKHRLENVSLADTLLYEYFSKRFQKRVNDYGLDRMANKVAELREITKSLQNRCVAGRKPDSNETAQGFNTKYIVQYNVRDDRDFMCQRMLISELNYTEILRVKQHSPPY